MGNPPKKRNMRKKYDYPNRLVFRDKIKASGKYKESTAYNFETAVVNTSSMLYGKAQALWIELMPDVPLPKANPQEEKPKERSVSSSSSKSESSLPSRKEVLTTKMLKGWMHNVFSEDETLEFLVELWLNDEI